MGHFERIRYPDGQISAKFVSGPEGGVPLYIQERINSYEDLMYVRAIADTLPHNRLRLVIPCLFGQRSDRRFDDYQSFDLKLIAEIINSCNFSSVDIFDPHSDVCMALINNSMKKSSFEYVKKAVKEVQGRQVGGELVLVAPDAGAYKKVFEYAEKLDLPVVGAMKHRSSDGRIAMVFTGDVEGKECFIVDDFCDGGRTFIELAKRLRAQGALKVYLYVSHGLFSQGFIELTTHISHIYCTNSIKDLDMENRGTCGGSTLSDYLTQYKVI